MRKTTCHANEVGVDEKSYGRAEARLVVLGFQAPSLTKVETSAPTLSRKGRSILPSCAANHRFVLESSNVGMSSVPSNGRESRR